MSHGPAVLREVIINPAEVQPSIYIHSRDGLFVPHGLADSFGAVDRKLNPRQLATYEAMQRSIVTLPSNLKLAIIQPEHTGGPRHVMIRLSPLNDEAPSSTPENIHSYCSRTNDTDKEVAQPNSWRPLTNLHGTGHFSAAEGQNVAHIQLFQPDADSMTARQRLRVVSHNAHPYGELVEAGLSYVEVQQGYKFDVLHFFAAGLGLKALGAADYFVRQGVREIGSVTAMNFAIDPNPIRALINYMARSTTGQPSDLALPAGYQPVHEFSIATTLDKLGAEKAMRRRQLKAFRRFLMLSSLISAKRAPHYIDNLLSSGVTITLANAINESLTQRSTALMGHQTTSSPFFHEVKIVGVEGTKTGMMTNEFFALSALITHIGLKNYDLDRQKQ